MNEELLKIYEDNVNEYGLPVFDLFTWQNLNTKYVDTDMSLPMSKRAKVMIDTMIHFFEKHHPKFPFREFNMHEVRQNFYDLRDLNLKDNIFPKEKCKTVHEKYDDYVGNFPEWGIGILNFSATHNTMSDAFMNRERMKCGYDRSPSPIEMWEEQTNLKQILSPIWRLHPTCEMPLKNNLYIEGIRVGAYFAGQFKPSVAKAFYDFTKSKKVLDTSSGWGDRMAGFFTSNAEEYYGMDPNGDLHENYHKMAVQYENWLGTEKPKSEFGDKWFSVEGKKKIKIYRYPAEDLPWDEIPNDIDIMFSSPPYFATERYAEGSKFEDDQSWSRYNSYEEWRDGFYLPVMKKAFDKLSPGGWLMVNIMDPKVKGKRHKSCDDLVNDLKEYFKGQIGMRIMARPKSIKSFEGDTHEERKAKYDEWQAKWFVESVWCFQKPGGEDVDLFSPYKDSTLGGMGPAVIQEPIKKKKLSQATTEKSSLTGFFD
jgi:hypothetical protein